MKVIWFMKGYSNLFHAINDIKKDTRFKILCSHTNPGFVGFENSDFYEVEPRVDDPEFLEWCKVIVDKYKVDVIFAANRQEALDKNRDMFPHINIATVASHKLIPVINDKARLYAYLAGGKVKIPEYGVFKNSIQFNTEYKRIKKSYPELCMKPTHGVYGSGFFILKSHSNDLETFLAQEQIVSLKKFKANIQNKKFKPMILMQYLEGVERSVDCVAYQGKLVGGVIRKKHSSYLPQEIEDNPDIMEQVTWMVEKLQLNGMFNAQFKDTKGVPYLLEINPRLSGRSFYATLAGLNIPLVAAQLMSGLIEPDSVQYQIDYGMQLSALHSPVIAENYRKRI